MKKLKKKCFQPFIFVLQPKSTITTKQITHSYLWQLTKAKIWKHYRYRGMNFFFHNKILFGDYVHTEENLVYRNLVDSEKYSVHQTVLYTQWFIKIGLWTADRSQNSHFRTTTKSMIWVIRATRKPLVFQYPILERGSPALLLLCQAQGTSPGFCNGLDRRALGESCPPTIGKLRG